LERKWKSLRLYILTLRLLFSVIYLYKNEIKCVIFLPFVGDD